MTHTIHQTEGDFHEDATLADQVCFLKQHGHDTACRALGAVLVRDPDNGGQWRRFKNARDVTDWLGY